MKALGSVVKGTKTLHAPGSKPNADEKLWGLLKAKVESNKPMEVRELPKRVITKISMRADKSLVDRAHKLHDALLVFVKSLKGLELKRGLANMTKLRKITDKDVRALTRYHSTIERASARHSKKLSTLLNRYGAMQSAMSKRHAWLVKTRDSESAKMGRKLRKEVEKEATKVRTLKANKSDVLQLSMELKSSKLMEHGNRSALLVDLDIDWFKANPAYVVRKSGQTFRIIFGSKEYEAIEEDHQTIIGTPGVQTFTNASKAIEGLRERFIGHVVKISGKEWVIVDSMEGSGRNQATFLALQISALNGQRPRIMRWRVADLNKAARSLRTKVRHDMVLKARQKAMELVKTAQHDQENTDRLKELDVREGDTVMVQYTKPNIQREEPVVAVNVNAGVIRVRSGYGAESREVEGRYVLHVTSSNH